VTFVCDLDQTNAADQQALGGKGWNLAFLIRAELPVPPGFCISSAAYRAALGHGCETPQLSDLIQKEVAAAYRRLGGGCVAVRSSATLEDSNAASFAGLQETILGVEGEAALAAAVERCWRSLQSDRAKAYRHERNIDDSQLAMAVVVQRLVPAEAAGVLFTRDPLDADGRLMLVEAAWGLGEAVVSGRVTPDRFRLHRETGQVIDRQISMKTVRATVNGAEPVVEELQCVACLDERQLAALAGLARQVESVYGQPRDIEWAWWNGRAWLLQARPITAPGAFEREQARRAEISRLAALADTRGTVWARFNLSEVLPAPTPMTWAIVRRLMSGRGGLGLMFRELGFDPDPAFDELGTNDLICGRTFVNLSREARSHFRGLPYHHPLAELKEHPERAFYAKPKPDPSQVDMRFVLRLPALVFKMMRAQRRIGHESLMLADRLRREVFPQFLAGVEAARQVRLADLNGPQLLDRLRDWLRRTLDDLARWSLRPAVLAAEALDAVEQRLARVLASGEAAAVTRSLLAGVRPDPEADLAGDLEAVADRRLSHEEFLNRHGHRGPQEMELEAPRWREDSGLLLQTLQRGSDGWSSRSRMPQPAKCGTPTDVDAGTRKAIEHDLNRARTYMSLRETGKHYFMLGYELIRQTLVELGERFKLADDVFYLEPDELPRLIAGENLSELAARRRKHRQLVLSVEVPPVLFSDDLAAIGRPSPVVSAAQLQGTPVSAGVAEGPALVLEQPIAPQDIPADFILVCPSTDPAWVPLFLRARGLVMETGGILSHGAIVAREFNLPAVVGISQAVERIRSGQRLRIDGNAGCVYLLD
jgi:pyruvate,water dikinase